MSIKGKAALGAVFDTKCGVQVQVVDTLDHIQEKVRIRWMDSAANEVDVSIYHLQKGLVKNPCQNFDQRRKYNPGDVFESLSSGQYTVLQVQDSLSVRIQFHNTGAVTTEPGRSVVRGEVRDPLAPLIMGRGFIGQGKYKPHENEPAYARWSNMFTRCYDPSSVGWVAYGAKGANVAEVWFNFQNYAEWYYRVNPSGLMGLEVDKDILHPGNMTYSPDYCSIVPKYVNNAIIIRHRGNPTYPIGVKYNCRKKKFKSDFRLDKNHHQLGFFSTAIEAHSHWQEIKANQLEGIVHRYVKEECFNTNVADAIMKRVWDLRTNAATGMVTDSL